MTDLRTVPITHIDTSADNPRRYLWHDEHSQDELVASIQTHGIIEPLIVRPNGSDVYQLVAGHRRLAAAIHAGLDSVPVVVRPDLDDASAVAMALVENLHREDIDPVDEATGYGTLKGFGWKQKQIAEAVGRSEGHVSKRLRLLRLPDDVLELVQSGELSIDIGYELTVTAEKYGLDPSALAHELLDMPVGNRASGLNRVIEDQKWLQDKEQFSRKLEGDGHQRLEVKDDPANRWYRPRPKDPDADMVVAYGVDVDVKRHQKEPCSRFTVTVAFDKRGRRIPEAEWWCADPSRHTPDGDSKLKMKDAQAERLREKEEQAEAEKRRKAARKRRAHFIDRVFTDPAIQSAVDYDDVVTRGWEVLAERIEVNTARKACQYLNLEPIEREQSWSDKPYQDWSATLARALDHDLYRTLLAIDIAHGENRESSGWAPEESLPIQRHFEFMSKLGWTDTPELDV